jgi:hypothetical protein
MDKDKIPLPDPPLVLPSTEPERPAEALILGLLNTRSSSSPLWSGRRLYPLLEERVLRPIDLSGLPFAGPSRELRLYPGAKRRFQSETNSGRCTCQRGI